MSALSGSEPRRSNVLLIVSLCLNLVLAGIIAMAVARFVWHRPFVPQNGAPQQEHVQVRQVLAPRLLMRIVPEKADTVRVLARAHREHVDGLRREANEARRQVLVLYGAPVFDKAAFAKATARMQAADAALEAEALNLAGETAAMLSPEERKRVSEWRGHGFGGGFGWQGHGHGSPDGRPANDQPADGDR